MGKGVRVGMRGVSFDKLRMNNGLRVDDGGRFGGVSMQGYWLGVIVR